MTKPYFEADNFRLFQGDSLELLKLVKPKSVDMIFADPPYFLSNGGISCKAGKMVSVNKANWDKSKGVDADFRFTKQWIKACRNVLKDDGTLWISGTMHNIYQVGFALQKNGYKILNEITWFKPNAPPNLSCKYFAHAHETILWARKHEKVPHYFDYKLMREKYGDLVTPFGKQMRSVWHIPLTPQSEKKSGKHPTQKPEELLTRIILSSTKPGARVLDPFNGSGTTGIVAAKHGREYIGFDKEGKYLDLTLKRLKYNK